MTKPKIEQFKEVARHCEEAIRRDRKMLRDLRRRGDPEMIKLFSGLVKDWINLRDKVVREIIAFRKANMDVIKMDDVSVELHSWVGKNAKGKKQEEIKKQFAARMAKIARFINCDRVEYIDGKTEEYVFHKINGGGMLRMETGCTVLPPTSWIKFGIELPKAEPQDQPLQPVEEKACKAHACNAVAKKDGGDIHACNAVVKVKKTKKKKK